MRGFATKLFPNLTMQWWKLKKNYLRSAIFFSNMKSIIWRKKSNIFTINWTFFLLFSFFTFTNITLEYFPAKAAAFMKLQLLKSMQYDRALTEHSINSWRLNKVNKFVAWFDK